MTATIPEATSMAGWKATAEALRHDIERHIQIATDQQADIERLRAEHAVLRGALLTYGHHTSGCRWNGGFDCSCGWSSITHEQNT